MPAKNIKGRKTSGQDRRYTRAAAPDTPGKRIGLWVKHLMQHRAVSVPELMRRTGIPQSGIANLTLGFVKNPRLPRLQQLADALEVPFSLITDAVDHPHDELVRRLVAFDVERAAS